MSLFAQCIPVCVSLFTLLPYFAVCPLILHTYIQFCAEVFLKLYLFVIYHFRNIFRSFFRNYNIFYTVLIEFLVCVYALAIPNDHSTLYLFGVIIWRLLHFSAGFYTPNNLKFCRSFIVIETIFCFFFRKSLFFF